MPSKSKSSSVNKGLKSEKNEENIFESKYVATKFNTFFCNIADKLVNKLPTRKFDEDQITNYKEKGVNANSFNVTVVTGEEVLKLHLL